MISSYILVKNCGIPVPCHHLSKSAYAVLIVVFKSFHQVATLSYTSPRPTSLAHSRTVDLSPSQVFLSQVITGSSFTPVALPLLSRTSAGEKNFLTLSHTVFNPSPSFSNTSTGFSSPIPLKNSPTLPNASIMKSAMGATNRLTKLNPILTKFTTVLRIENTPSRPFLILFILVPSSLALPNHSTTRSTAFPKSRVMLNSFSASMKPKAL